MEGYHRCPETGGLVFVPPPASEDARLTAIEQKLEALFKALPPELRIKLPAEYFC